MRRLIIFLLFLIVSVWFGIEFVRHPGFLLIVYQPWSIQMPLWFAIVGLILFFGLFYFLVNSIDRLSFLCVRFKNWLHTRKEHQSFSKTQLGLIALIEGRFKKAEKWLMHGVKQSIEPLINYLGAAKAAHELKAYERRDQYIQKAYQVAPKATLAIGLTQAKFELDQHHFEQAEASLNHLRQLSPRHPQVLTLLKTIYERLGDFNHLLLLLPDLHRAKLITSDEYVSLEKNIYCEEFRAASNKRLTDVRLIWNQMPRYLKRNRDVVLAYVTQLLHHANTQGPEVIKESEELIRKTLKHNWSAELVNLYGGLPLNHLNRQLVIVGAWVKMYGQRPELLWVLGKLCVRLKLWGKAKDYFARCLAQGPNALVSLEYGKLLEELHESEEAMKVYRDGLRNAETTIITK